jgi:hypothetical protein
MNQMVSVKRKLQALMNLIDGALSVNDLHNSKNIQYTANFFVGDGNVYCELLFDTSFNWLAVNRDDCETCNSRKYEPRHSF